MNIYDSGSRTFASTFAMCLTISARSLIFTCIVLALVGHGTIASGAQEQGPAVTSANSSSDKNFATLMQLAGKEREAGNSDAAMSAYERALQMRPAWAEGLWYLGTLQYGSNRYAPAIGNFQKLVGLTPQDGSAWMFLGLCEFEVKDYDNALVHLRRGAALGAPEDPEIALVATYHLAQLQVRAGQFESTTKTLADAFADKPFPTQAKAVLGLALLRAPLLPQEVDPSHDALVERAGEVASSLAHGDTAKALDMFPALLKDYPDTPYLHFAYGVALASVGRLDDALIQLRAEGKESPQSPLPQSVMTVVQQRLHHELGTAQAGPLTGQKPLREARMIAVYGAPGPTAKSASATADFDRASRAAAAAEASGSVDKAIRSYERALQFRPDWDEGLWRLAMLNYASARYREAVPSLTNFLNRNARDGTAWAVLGLCEFNIKDYDNALIHLERGELLQPRGSPESVQLARYDLGILLNRSSRFDEASEILGKAASTAGPHGKEIQFAMGSSQLRMALLPEQVPQSTRAVVEMAGSAGESLQDQAYEKAFAQFQLALAQYPRTPFLHYAYGVALASLSEYDEAAEQMRDELAISPTSEWPQIRLAWIALRQRRAADAIGPAISAVAIDPESAQAHYLLGRAYLESDSVEADRLALAVAELERANKMLPGSPATHFALAKAYAKSGQRGKADEERAEFSRLSALAQQQSGVSTAAYGGPRDAGGISSP